VYRGEAGSSTAANALSIAVKVIPAFAASVRGYSSEGVVFIGRAQG
jgi:hypothetical protein